VKGPVGFRLHGPAHIALPCRDLVEVLRHDTLAERRVGLTMIEQLRVSTVFLMVNWNPGEGEPILFETMISFDGYALFRERCATWAEAEELHHYGVFRARFLAVSWKAHAA
jgi:hypothetical protein